MQEILNQFKEITGDDLKDEQIELIDRGCPHRPKGLPDGKMAIYMFRFGESFLKIGKVGRNSKARFLSQHYNPDSSESNLAKSILHDPIMQKLNLNKYTIGTWIKQNTRRIDILIDATVGEINLDKFERYLHSQFHPKYEGPKKIKG